jgi:hypothetical protein
MTTRLSDMHFRSARSMRVRNASRRTSATPGSIRDVSDTALWVAMYRAIESERPDALFHDPHARRMAGERGTAILRALPFGESLGWALIVRTRLIDEAVERAIANGARTVLNLGAGLDTRAFRLNVPSSLRWFDVDLPPIVEHRRRCLGGEAARCEHAHVAADLQSADACSELLRASGPPANRPWCSRKVCWSTSHPSRSPTRAPSARRAFDALVGDRRRHSAAGAHGRDGLAAGAGRCAVPLYARRQHEGLRSAGMAGDGVPLDLGGVDPPAAHDAAGSVVDVARPVRDADAPRSDPAECRASSCSSVLDKENGSPQRAVRSGGLSPDQAARFAFAAGT